MFEPDVISECGLDLRLHVLAARGYVLRWIRTCLGAEQCDISRFHHHDVFQLCFVI